MKKARGRKEKIPKVDLQFQVHASGEEDDDTALRTRSGRPYSKTPQLPTRKSKIKSNVKSYPGSPVPVETSTEGMDSEEGEKISRKLRERLEEGLNPQGRFHMPEKKPTSSQSAKLNPGEKSSSGESNGLERPELPSKTEPIKERRTILEVPQYQESDKWTGQKSEVHPPQLVAGPSDASPDRKLLRPQPKFSVQSFPETIAKGENPRVAGKRLGFVPYKGPKTLEEAPRTPGADLYIRLGEGMAVTQMSAWHIPDKSPEGHDMIEIFVDSWREKYKTNIFCIDVKTGQVYARKGRGLELIPEQCSTRPIVGTQSMHTTPVQGAGDQPSEVRTPQGSILTRPLAESTGRGLRYDISELGESYEQPGIETGGFVITTQASPGEFTIGGTSRLRPTPSYTGQFSDTLGQEELSDDSISMETGMAMQSHLEQNLRKAARQVVADVMGSALEELGQEEEAERTTVPETPPKSQQQESEQSPGMNTNVTTPKTTATSLSTGKLVTPGQMQRVNFLRGEIVRLFEEKEVLIKRLIEKRKKQIRAGLETEEQEDVRREEMRSEYADHIAQYVDYIKEYWVKAPIDPMNPLTVPGTEKIDDDISYTHCHEWDEEEFMLLIFKIEILLQQKEFWPDIERIAKELEPGKESLNAKQALEIQRDWRTEWQRAQSWYSIAKATLTQERCKRELQAERVKHAELQRQLKEALSRPAMVTPEEVKPKEKKGDGKGVVKHSKQPRPITPISESIVDPVRKPKNKYGSKIPSPTQIQASKEAALNEATNMLKYNKQESIKRTKTIGDNLPSVTGQQNSQQTYGKKVPSPTNSQRAGVTLPIRGDGPRRQIQHSPEAVKGYQYQPRRGEYKPLKGPERITGHGPGDPEAWACENCGTSHKGATCPCPTCNQRGHYYYECPHKSESESSFTSPDKQWQEKIDEPKVGNKGERCPRCGNFHPRDKGCPPPPMENIPRQCGKCGTEHMNTNPCPTSVGATPFCMHCGLPGNTHDVNCPIVRNKSRLFICTFCGQVGHRADNCMLRLNELQKQQLGYLCNYCGSADHVVQNCTKHAAVIEGQKIEINKRNAAKYRAARYDEQPCDGGGHNPPPSPQENHASQPQGPADLNQNRSGEEGRTPRDENTGQGNGGQPPRKPGGNGNGDPPDSPDEGDEGDEEDDDKTETVSASSEASAQIVDAKGLKVPLKKVLKGF